MRKSFTLLELLMVIAIIVILLSLLYPGITKSIQSAELVTCASNKKQNYTMTLLYTRDYNGRLPNFYGYMYGSPTGNMKTDDWLGSYDKNGTLHDGVILNYSKSTEMMRCPSLLEGVVGSGTGSNGVFDISYVEAFASSRLTSISTKSKRWPNWDAWVTPLVVEEDPSYINGDHMEGGFAHQDPLAVNHGNKGSYTGLDGSLNIYRGQPNNPNAMWARSFHTVIKKDSSGNEIWIELPLGGITWEKRKELY